MPAGPESLSLEPYGTRVHANKSPDRLLGKKLKEYLLQDYNPDEMLLNIEVDNHAVESTVNSILTGNDVTFATLRDLIRLPAIPRASTFLRGTPTIPTLMGYLRQYCQYHEPYDYEFGFHCIEAILFALGFGLMEEANLLPNYNLEVQRIIDHPKATLRQLHLAIAELLTRYITQDDGPDDGPESINDNLWGFDYPTQTLVPILGGLTIEDLQYFTNILWNNRKQMFWAYSAASASPGWGCTLFFFSLVNRHVLQDTELCTKVYNLAFRVSLSSSTHKYDLLDRVLHKAYVIFQPPHGRISGAVDKEDAVLMAREYHRYITSRNRRHHRSGIYCTLWAHNTIRGLNSFDMNCEHIKALIDSLWANGVLAGHDILLADIEEYFDAQAPLIKYMEFVLRGINNIIAIARPSHRVAYFRILFQADFVNLLGRLLLSSICPFDSKAAALEDLLGAYQFRYHVHITVTSIG
ncbi:hypothetical protein RhiJN_15166 [Ceratobasidium sp. AG-Ba]|nr:hypothetical protein RhiJN_15166 [Ceratobasidium sp. AG-Ba]